MLDIQVMNLECVVGHTRLVVLLNLYQKEGTSL